MKVRPVQFKFGEYLNGGLELFKKDYGNFILAYFFCMILSIVPLCSLMAMGNFYKYCKKVHNNEQANPGDIFNFDDFSTYLILNLILLGVVIVGYVPMFFFGPMAAILSDGNSAVAGTIGIFGGLYLIAFIVFIFVIFSKAFYIPGLVSLKNYTDIKEAWRASNIMTTGNLLMIVLFSIVVSFLAQIGILLCGIGIFLTIPFAYTSNFIAYHDAFQQIDHDEIKEIGQNNY